MYSILMDSKTKTYYMEPGDVAFHIYSGENVPPMRSPHLRVVPIDVDDPKELETLLYNAGFFAGYIDGQFVRLSKGNIYYYDRNPNEVSYAQYILTKDQKYLEIIKKDRLFTLCKIEGSSVLVPTVTLEDGGFAILAYTDKLRIPQALFEKYKGWKFTTMTFDARCVVNGLFVAE